MYLPNWDSLDRRAVPLWYDAAKIGVRIHWGLYSIPAWAVPARNRREGGESHAEWYGYFMQDRDSVFHEHAVSTFGDGVRYRDLPSQFRPQAFDPDAWADLFARSGVRYAILAAKHHDGYCLWPSEQACGFDSVSTGPHRDIVAEVTDAVRRKGLRMGVACSLTDWFNESYQRLPARYAAETTLPQLTDLVERYQPDILFGDGETDHFGDTFGTATFLAWLFNESPVAQHVAVNDRWGAETRGRHGGYRTTEYGEVRPGHILTGHRKWEECRGLGSSFGYNRAEDVSDYLGAGDLIHLLIDTVAENGNLLLSVGPDADGRIPVIVQERLLEMGEWLAANGDAIYGCHPWRVRGEGDNVRYTQDIDSVYAFCKHWPEDGLVLEAPRPTYASVRLLGHDGLLSWSLENGKMRIRPPALGPDDLPFRHAYVFKLRGVE